jgi:hypothetical protein
VEPPAEWVHRQFASKVNDFASAVHPDDVQVSICIGM